MTFSAELSVEAAVLSTSVHVLEHGMFVHDVVVPWIPRDRDR